MKLKQGPFRTLISLPASAVAGTVVGAARALTMLPLLLVSPVGGTALILDQLTLGIRHPSRTLSELFRNREGRQQHFTQLSQTALKEGDADKLVAALQNQVLVDPTNPLSNFLLGFNCLDLFRVCIDKPALQVAMDNPVMVESAKASKVEFAPLSEFSFLNLLRKKPRHVSGIMMLSQLYADQGKMGDALDLLQQSRKKASDKNRFLLDEHEESLRRDDEKHKKQSDLPTIPPQPEGVTIPADVLHTNAVSGLNEEAGVVLPVAVQGQLQEEPPEEPADRKV